MPLYLEDVVMEVTRHLFIQIFIYSLSFKIWIAAWVNLLDVLGVVIQKGIHFQIIELAQNLKNFGSQTPSNQLVIAEMQEDGSREILE